jgi:hypothetical protein
MNIDPMVAALVALCKREGDYKDVADKSGISPGNLWQIINGTELPSGNPRGVGPKLRLKITAAYPDWLSPTLSAQIPNGTELTSHVNPSLHQASSGASAPATLQNALEFLAGYLSALDAGDRARAVRDIADLADEPQAVAKITARIEAMASPAFTHKKRSNG